jgi:transposase InsO family protein
MDSECECLALAIRKKGFTLDECLEAVQQLYPKLRRSVLHRFFVRQGVNKLACKAKRPKKKYKNYEPGFLHVDTFNMPKLGGRKRYCFLGVDRATRMLFLRVYDGKSKHSSVDFLLGALEFFPFKIHRVLTDNGSEYTNHYYKGGQECRKHQFVLVCELNGILHRHTQIRTPQTNGMAERMVRMVKDKALRPVRFNTHEEMEKAVIAWSHTYNCFRKHGSLERRTPLDVARTWYKEKPGIFTRDPDTILQVFAT